jgi:hypothetical protein
VRLWREAIIFAGPSYIWENMIFSFSLHLYNFFVLMANISALCRTFRFLHLLVNLNAVTVLTI